MAQQYNEQLKDKKFYEEIHFIRAFACIGVLLVHISASYDFNSFTYMFNQLGRFGTPSFALISGFLLFAQVKNKGFDYQNFIKSRFSKIIMPFVVWSSFYLVIQSFTTNSEINGNYLLKVFVLGDGFYHLYFMVIVIQFYILFPTLQYIRTKFSWTLALIISFIVTFFSLKYQNTFQLEGEFGTIFNDPIFITKWIFYFIFGGFLAFYWESFYRFTKKPFLMLLVILFVFGFTIVEYQIVGAISSRRISNLINIPLLTLSVIGIYPYLKKLKFLYRPLKTIGTLSMGIYLVHPFVLLLLKSIIPKQFWVTQSFPIMFGIVLLLSIFIVQVIRQLSIVQYIVPVPRLQPNK